jgi:hypothetical protein
MADDIAAFLREWSADKVRPGDAPRTGFASLSFAERHKLGAAADEIDRLRNLIIITAMSAETTVNVSVIRNMLRMANDRANPQPPIGRHG